jgi:hypothetical protein
MNGFELFVETRQNVGTGVMCCEIIAGVEDTFCNGVWEIQPVDRTSPIMKKIIKKKSLNYCHRATLILNFISNIYSVEILFHRINLSPFASALPREAGGEKIKKTGADIVITSCPFCEFHIMDHTDRPVKNIATVLLEGPAEWEELKRWTPSFITIFKLTRILRIQYICR